MDEFASRYMEKLCASTLYLSTGKHTSLFRKQQMTFFGTKVEPDYRLLAKSSKYYAVTVAFFAQN